MTTPALSLDPRSLRFAAAGTLAVGTAAVVSMLAGMRLPHDDRYYLLLRLMWQGNEWGIPVVLAVFAALQALLVLWGLLLLALALSSSSRWDPTRRLVDRLWPGAVVFPIYYFSATSLGRVVANILYASQGSPAFQLTPWLARLEGPILIGLQGSLTGPMVSAVAAAVYSYVWFGGLLAAVPSFALARDAEGAVAAALGPAMLSLVALPFYMLFPVFDPWTLNPAYGAAGGLRFEVAYLYPGASHELLQSVIRDAPGVVGSCLPSLHVAIPAFFAMLAAHRGHKAIAWAYVLITFLVVWAVSWLGRHWITDSIVAIPFAWACLAVLTSLQSDGVKMIRRVTRHQTVHRKMP